MNSLDTKIVFHDSWVITNVALIRKYVAKIFILQFSSYISFNSLFNLLFIGHTFRNYLRPVLWAYSKIIPLIIEIFFIILSTTSPDLFAQQTI